MKGRAPAQAQPSEQPEPDSGSPERLRSVARRVAAELLRWPHHSPEFRRQVAAVQALGQQAQIQAAGPLDSALAAAADPAPPLSELRLLVARLQPARPGPLARLLGRRPAAPTPQEYAEVAAQSTPLLERLYRSQDVLRRQQVTLSSEQRRLEGTRAGLERALTLAAELELLLTASLPELRVRQPLHAAAVQSEVLDILQERRTDLSAALASAAQSQLALELARTQAAELDAQLERSAAGIVLALKLARSASQAAELRSGAAGASTQVQEAQRRMEGAASLDQLNTALAQAYAALDDLERIERQARSALPTAD